MNRRAGEILAALMAAAVMLAVTFWAKRSGISSNAMILCVDAIAAAAYLVFQRLLIGRRYDRRACRLPADDGRS